MSAWSFLGLCAFSSFGALPSLPSLSVHQPSPHPTSHRPSTIHTQTQPSINPAPSYRPPFAAAAAAAETADVLRTGAMPMRAWRPFL